MSITVDLIAAARPNFMKVAPLYRALARNDGWCRFRLIHTGQHYDSNMSDAFFRDLGLPDPDIHLGVGSGSHAEQAAGVMLAYEKVCLGERPDWVIVVGDVNSTMSCTLVASKLGIPVAHLEAGLRSRDRSMPEEINRLVTDVLADVLWTPSPDADENLRNEGIAPEKICRVGNIMIDALEMSRPLIERRNFAAEIGVNDGRYGVVTLHRPSNVDDKRQLSTLLEMLGKSTAKCSFVFPVHPRTRKRLLDFGLWEAIKAMDRLWIIEPVGYVEFMSLVFDCHAVITDSGGVQEETTYLGIPCITLRVSTERPITVTQGTNRLMQPGDVPDALDRILDGKWPKGMKPELWDGRTADRVLGDLKSRLKL